MTIGQYKMIGSARKCGFTLVEVIIAIAVVLVVAAILIPVFARSKQSAFRTNDLSNMRQLGAAAAIYSDTYGFPPTGCPVLVDSNLAPEALCAGKSDPYDEGLGNRLVKRIAQDSDMYKDLDVPYQLTFIGWREFAIPQHLLDDVVGQDLSVGWLVDLSTSDNIENQELFPPGALTGRYRRLLLDSSVVWRTHRTVKEIQSGPRVWMPIMLFADVDDKWVKSQALPMP